jgi:hypothetical protein
MQISVTKDYKNKKTITSKVVRFIVHLIFWNSKLLDAGTCEFCQISADHKQIRRPESRTENLRFQLLSPKFLLRLACWVIDLQEHWFILPMLGPFVSIAQLPASTPLPLHAGIRLRWKMAVIGGISSKSCWLLSCHSTHGKIIYTESITRLRWAKNVLDRYIELVLKLKHFSIFAKKT